MNPGSQYVWGAPKAAAYLGVSETTFWRLRHSKELTDAERKLVAPRIIQGRMAFRKRDLDLFMSPALNAPGAKPHDPFPRSPSS